ncbi:hypothetical protein SNE40_015602 [Patella caerulea]|uniref:SMB domain-containing protein n=1 Tax=Patella caerulea TaxID=87958 RepID=A0AAN8JMI8_PATCE
MHVCLARVVFVFIWQGMLSSGKVFQEWDYSPLDSSYKEIITSPLVTSTESISKNLVARHSVFSTSEIQTTEFTPSQVIGSEFQKSSVTTLDLATAYSTMSNAELSSATTSSYGYLATHSSAIISNADETRSFISQPSELTLTIVQQRVTTPNTNYKEITTLPTVTRTDGMNKNLSQCFLARASNGQTKDVNTMADLNDKSTSLSNPSLSKTQPRFDCDSRFVRLSNKNLCKKELRDEFFCLGDVISCRDRCGMEAITRCSCEVHCELYGTCCADFRSECPNLWFDAKERLSDILGVTVDCIDNSPGYILISSCSQKNSSAHIVSKCLSDNIEPVSISNYHFKNIQCLLCNGFVLADAQSWNLNLRIEFGRDIDPSFFEKTDISLISTHGIFQWIPPPLPSLYFCPKQIISDCPDGNDMQVKHKCLANRSPVSVIADGKKTLYQNRYCAACHVNSSLYVCNSAATSDFAHVTQGPARYSTIINWKLNSDKTKAILYAARPFLWRMMTCNISENNIKMPDCKIVTCYNSRQVVDHICALSACARAFITWNGHHQVDATCTDQSCVNNVMDRMLSRILQNIQVEFPSMTFGATSRDTEKYELYIKMLFSNWDRASSDSETVQRLFELYQQALQIDLRGQIFSGSTISVKIGFTSNTNCLVKYQSRNITIIGPTPSSSGRSSLSFMAVSLYLFLNAYW